MIKKVLILLVMPMLTACSALSPPTPLLSSIELDKLENLVRIRIQTHFLSNEKIGDTKIKESFNSELKKLLTDVLTLAELKCESYFIRLGSSQQKLGFGRREATLAGGAVSAFLGLANATSKTISNTGTAFALGIASLDTYEDVFLFSPDVGAVQALVRSSQQAFLQSLAPSSIEDIATVIRVSTDFENICQVHTIRRLVNQSVSNAKPKVETAEQSKVKVELLPKPTLPIPPSGAPADPDSQINFQPFSTYTGITIQVR